MMAKKNLNQALNKANKEKNDEFFTQLTDIEKELKHYRPHFKDKVVFCNCDDPRVSNFFHYFSYNFEKLGLKKLITTSYKNQNADLFSTKESDKAIYLEYEGDKNGNQIPDPEEIGIKQLNGDGDFRSPECVELLKQADIVVTNPPFSLFREYILQLIQYDKKFIILGNQNAITYKEIFQLFREDKIWVGIDNFGTKWFEVPNEYDINTESRKKVEDGKKYFSMGNIMWFTNLENQKRHEEIILYRNYVPEDYPKYDNYDAIEVSRYTDIPIDYEGVMGVPVSFLNKYNPSQFEIVGSDYEVKLGLLPDLLNKNWDGKTDRAYLNGRRLYSRILIRNRKINNH